MKQAGFALLALIIFSCGNNKGVQPTEEEETSFNYERFSARFKEATLPYQLSDTGLLNNKDTTRINNPVFASFITDSLKLKIFGKGAKPKYIPMAKMGSDGKEHYYIVKAVNGTKKAALLIAFDKNNAFGAAFPFLIPDSDTKTSQISTIDKAYSISRIVSSRGSNERITEGKNVYAYNNDAKDFTLIMTDLLDDSKIELINPIDTFAKTHKFAGDYINDKKNMVSVRDGRNEKEINFFIHFEKNEGDCSGELKGTAFFRAAKTAVYRQGGDACVLELNFGASSVTLKEMEGCGVHRDVRCVFDGTFTKKKPVKSKSTKAKKK